MVQRCFFLTSGLFQAGPLSLSTWKVLSPLPKSCPLPLSLLQPYSWEVGGPGFQPRHLTSDYNSQTYMRDFIGEPVVKTLCFQCKGWQKKKKKKLTIYLSFLLGPDSNISTLRYFCFNRNMDLEGTPASASSSVKREQ